MFNFLTDSIENALDVVTDVFEGDFDKRKIAKLIADGVSISVIAHGLGVAEDAIEKMLED